MVLLSIQNVTKRFGTNEVLSDIGLTLKENQRMGLVGVNGSGKTTLFKLIAGQMQPDEGTITIARGTRVGMLSQQADITEDSTVLEELSRVFEPLQLMEKRMRELEERMSQVEGNAREFDALAREYARVTARYEQEGGYEWPSRIQGVLAGLGFAKDRADARASILSGGEKTRLCLARILLMQPELLMLDEPTNHLDLNAAAWLEDTLKKYRGTVLIISHDRYLLNEVCDSIAEIRGAHLAQYDGNYDTFAQKREENLIRQMKEYKLQQAEIARHEAIIARYRSFNREKSIIAARSWEKKLKRIEDAMVDRPVDEHKVRFSFGVRRRSGEDVLMVQDLAQGFDGRTLFEGFSLKLRAGDRAALIGPNGIGKTTLLRTIIGQLKPMHGTVLFGTAVDLGYYDQQQQGLDDQKTILNEVWDSYPRMEPGDVRSVLALFLFTGDDVFQRVGTLSGGEKGRVALSKLMLKRDNLLLLDEPTNHLDMDSREVLEHALDEFPGTILTVSHDRYFINRVCDRVIEMTAEGTTEYLGNYDDYTEKKRRMAAGAEEGVLNGRTRTEVEREKRKARTLREAQKAQEALVGQLERDIARAEAELGSLEAKLADPATYQDRAEAEELARAHKELKAVIDALYARWAEEAEGVGDF